LPITAIPSYLELTGIPLLKDQTKIRRIVKDVDKRVVDQRKVLIKGTCIGLSIDIAFADKWVKFSRQVREERESTGKTRSRLGYFWRHATRDARVARATLYLGRNMFTATMGALDRGPRFCR
jgi:hypothetical protein